MEAKMSANEFEEHVRLQCVKILRAVQHGNSGQAGELASELCSLAASRKRERQMTAEAGTDYNLAALGGMAMDAPEIED